MTAQDPLDAAADLLAACRVQQKLFAGFPDDLRPASQTQAYEIQRRLHARLTSAGEGTVTGHKIGCTTTVMQEFLGIDSPCAGRLFSTRVFSAEGVFARRATGRLGVECEVAVVLGSDLRPRDRAYSAEDVASAVAGCLPAIEVVEDRYVDYSSLDTPSLIADDFFNSGAVLGPVVTDFDAADLSDVTAAMSIDGVEVGRGDGTAVMGHPLHALAWLANSASARGVALLAGDVVLLGSLVQTHWIEPPAHVEIVNSHLGRAVARFT